MDRIIDPKKFYTFLRRVHGYIKEAPEQALSQTRLSQKLNNHTLFKSALLKLAEEGYIRKEDRVKSESKTGKVSVWYVYLKDLPFNLGLENLTPTEEDLHAVQIPLKDRILDVSKLSKEEIKKITSEWIETRPDFIALVGKTLLESITQQEFIDMSASTKLSKFCELIEKEMMLRGKSIGGNNFTLIMIENASNRLFNRDNSKEVNVEPTNLKEE